MLCHLPLSRLVQHCTLKHLQNITLIKSTSINWDTYLSLPTTVSLIRSKFLSEISKHPVNLHFLKLPVRLNWLYHRFMHLSSDGVEEHSATPKLQVGCMPSYSRSSYRISTLKHYLTSQFPPDMFYHSKYELVLHVYRIKMLARTT